MKIRKRYSPVDFQSLSDDEAAPMVVGFKLDATTDSELEAPTLAEPLFDEDHHEIERSETFSHGPAVQLAEAVARTPTPRIAEPRPPSGWPVYLAALFVSLTWAGAPIAFAFGYRQAKSPFDFDPFVMAVLGAMAIGPAALVWIAAYLIQQGRKLGVETRRAKVFADQMVGPTVMASAQAGELIQTMREEIVRASQAAEDARQTLLALRQSLAHESEHLVEATGRSAQVADTLTQALGHERDAMSTLSGTLDAQISKIRDSISRHTQTVSLASDLAETQLREAEASLAARTADLAAAAAEAGQTARVAGEDLNRHIARLETAGLGLSDQIAVAEKGLTEQRAGLVSVTHALRVDQEGYAAQAETHAAQLAQFIEQARISSVEMGDKAVLGSEALQDMIGQAARQFGELTQAAVVERQRLEAQGRASLEAMAAAGEQSRLVAERHMEIVRDQVDSLSEAAFAAGQKANQVFETRLAEAHDLIEKSARMVELAGATTARKLEEGAATARATLDELSNLLAQIETRAARLPATARGQAEAVRLAVTESMDDLMDQARRTAAETQAIDAAFQERVRRNYDMLSDAVRLMGSVAGAAPPALSAPPVPAERPALRAKRAAPAARAAEPPPMADAPAESSLDPVVEPQRTRLRLTPTASDAEFSEVFEAAAGRRGGLTKAVEKETPAWTWKDLLTSIDHPKPGSRGPTLTPTLAAEIKAMGIDPAALLPGAKTDDIAASLADQDADAAQEIVRRAAPAAIRRLTRRMLGDDALRDLAMGFLDDYCSALAQALAEQDPEGAAADLLNTQAGRVFLLLDAAAGDLA